MRLNIDVEIKCQLSHGDAALLMIEAASVPGQRVITASLDIEGARLHRPYAAGPAVWAIVAHDTLNLRYLAEVEITRTRVPVGRLSTNPPEALPADVLPYLRPSRYCQSDLFTDFARQQFGAMEGGAKIAAISDWVATTLTYTPGSSHAGTTAVETFADGKGVCRDFAHLVCALTRAAQIPARYVSVYGADVCPQDFHAAAQVWLAGAWHLVDATGMGAADTMAVIATGRDAGDVAFMETAHWAQSIRQIVCVTPV